MLIMKRLTNGLVKYPLLLWFPSCYDQLTMVNKPQFQSRVCFNYSIKDIWLQQWYAKLLKTPLGRTTFQTNIYKITVGQNFSKKIYFGTHNNTMVKFTSHGSC